MPQIFFLGMYAVLGEVLNARKLVRRRTPGPGAEQRRRAREPRPVPPALRRGGLATSRCRRARPSCSPAARRSARGAGADPRPASGERAGLQYRPDFRWRGVGLRATGQAAGWTFAMLVAHAGAPGSCRAPSRPARAAPGTSSCALSNAWLLFMLPHSIITVSLATRFYPRMSEHAARGRHRRRARRPERRRSASCCS